MVKLIERVHYQTTETELDALLMEAEVVRLHQPPYNVRLKDDKSPIYIVITKEDFPRVVTARKPQTRTGHIKALFGPFPSSYQVKKVIRYARLLFPFCNASVSDKQKHKACFYYHLNLCPGACMGGITKAEYALNINNLTLFLKGKKHQVVKNLISQMQDLSQRKEFEKAGKIKEQVTAIQEITKRFKSEEEHPLPNLEDDQSKNRLISLRHLLSQFLSLPAGYSLKRIECYDISNLSGKEATASMVVFNDGRPEKNQYRHFKIKTLNTPNDYAMLQEAIIRRQKHEEWGIPNLIVIDGGKGQLQSVQKVNSWTIPIVSIAKDPDRLIIKSNRGELKVIPLLPENPATSLLQQVRNESHRFAKKYHSLLHSKSVLQ